MANEEKNTKRQAFRATGSEGLVRNAEKRRAAEFERLYRENYSSVYGRVLFRMRSEEAALDVTAESFLRAARYFDRFDPKKAKFSTWVNAIANNCIIDFYRQHKEYAPLDEVSEGALASSEDVARTVTNADLAVRLLATLKDEDRQIVFMKFCEERPNGEIAEELNMNPSTVATRIQRALKRMRSALEGDA